MENKEQRSPEIEIDLLPLLKALLPNIWIMVVVGLILGGMIFGLTSYFVDPYYRCSFTAYVNNRHSQSDKDSLTSSDLNASQQLTNTYILILRSNQILTASAESINLDQSYSKLRKMVSAEVQGDTEIISVSVTSEDPRLAYSLASAIAQTAPSYMSDIVEGSSMKIIDYPVYTTARSGPSYTRYGLIGFMAGVFLVALIVIIRYFADDTVKSEAEIEQRFGLLSLGVIPDTLAAGNKKYGYYNYYYYGREHGSRKKGSDKDGK